MFNPATAYDAITRLDELAKRRQLIPGWQSWKPHGGEAVPLPPRLKRWLRKASTEDAEQFWGHLVEGRWRKAKRLAGLTDRDIEYLLEVIWNDRGSRGTASPERYMVYGLPVSKLWIAYRSLPEEHRQTIDRYRFAEDPPPWSRVKRDDRLAFALLADALNEIARGRK